jgi:hypothetical protein
MTRFQAGDLLFVSQLVTRPESISSSKTDDPSVEMTVRVTASIR